MKSIMEEASSVIKAIEKGWTQAGQPKEFSIKVFEEPQKNFIGMTIKSAKIGIFFDDPALSARMQESSTTKSPKKSRGVEPVRQQQPETPQQEKRAIPHKPKKEVVAQAPAPVTWQATEKETSQAEVIKQEVTQTKSPVWTEAMVQDIHSYMKDILAYVTIKPLAFTIEPHHFHLKLHFNESIFEDKAREKQLFVSLSTLLLQMLKYKYKRPLKGYKIVLVGASS